MVSAGGCRDGDGDGGAGVVDPKRLLSAEKDEVKLPKMLLEGVEGLSECAGVGDEIGDAALVSAAGDLCGVGDLGEVGDPGAGALEAS